MGKFDSYQAVTDSMIAALKEDRVPWQKPWVAASGRPRSISTGNAYRGINVLLLGLTAWDRGYKSPWWGTVKAINARGGHVREGQNRKNGQGGTMITFWKIDQRRVQDEATGEWAVKSFPMLRVYTVFNAEQCEGLPAKYTAVTGRTAPDVDATAQAVVEAYWDSPEGPAVSFGEVSGRAGYSDQLDKIFFPAKADFRDEAGLLTTEFHESVHSTGHKDRLGRPGVADFDHFGSERYAREELVAEMGSAFLAAEFGIEGRFEQSADYIRGWLRALENDPKLVVQAAAAAEKAVELVKAASTPAEDETPETAAEAA